MRLQDFEEKRNMLRIEGRRGGEWRLLGRASDWDGAETIEARLHDEFDFDETCIGSYEHADEDTVPDGWELLER